MWKLTHFCGPISINTRTQTKNSSVTPLLISMKIQNFWLGRGQFLKEKEYVFGANNSRVICFSLICSFLDATRLPIIQAHTYPGVSNFISKTPRVLEERRDDVKLKHVALQKASQKFYNSHCGPAEPST